MHNGTCAKCKTDEQKPTNGCYKENIWNNGCWGTYKYYTKMSESCWAWSKWDNSQCRCVDCNTLYPKSEGWYTSKPSGCWTAGEQVNCNGPVWTHYTNQADSCKGSFNSNTCTCTQCPSPYSMTITQLSQCNYLYNPSLSCIWGNQCCKCVWGELPDQLKCSDFEGCFNLQGECNAYWQQNYHDNWACDRVSYFTNKVYPAISCYCYTYHSLNI